MKTSMHGILSEGARRAEMRRQALGDYTLISPPTSDDWRNLRQELVAYMRGEGRLVKKVTTTALAEKAKQ